MSKDAEIDALKSEKKRIEEQFQTISKVEKQRKRRMRREIFPLILDERR